MDLSHWRSLAFSVVTLCATGGNAGEIPLSLCSSGVHGARGQAPTPAAQCVPLALAIEEVERKAKEAQHRDEEEIRAMRSVAAQSGAIGHRQRSRGNAQTVAPLSRVDEGHATGDDAVARNPAALPASQPRGAANPTALSASDTDAKQLEDAKKRAAIAAQKRRQVAAAKRAAAMRAARADAQQSGPASQISNPVPSFPAMRGGAPAAHSLP
jgi:hypothetical protein